MGGGEREKSETVTASPHGRGSQRVTGDPPAPCRRLNLNPPPLAHNPSHPISVGEGVKGEGSSPRPWRPGPVGREPKTGARSSCPGPDSRARAAGPSWMVIQGVR